jgi:hypothetical protein
VIPAVSNEALSAYLNDHLAGSVGAIEMVERAITENAGNSLARRLEQELEVIRKDQDIVRDLITRLGSTESRLKKAGAWLVEKAGRVKLGGTEEPTELSRMETLEALVVGIHGRRALWRALRVVADKHPVLRDLDLDLLERQTAQQHDRVEEWRLEAAKDVL